MSKFRTRVGDVAGGRAAGVVSSLVALEKFNLKPDLQRRGGEIAPAARQGEGPDSRAEARIGSLLASGFPVAPQIRTPRIERSPIPHAPQAEPERRPGVYTLTLVQVRFVDPGASAGLEFSAIRSLVAIPAPFQLLFSLWLLLPPPHHFVNDLVHPAYSLRNCSASASYLSPKSLTCLCSCPACVSC